MGSLHRILHPTFALILMAIAGMTCIFAQSTPLGYYCGRHTWWYSSVNVTSETELTINVGGPHSGYVPNATCYDVVYNMTSDGSMIMPEQEDPTSCIGYLTSGNGGTLSLTFNNVSNTILLGVRVPSTDITMAPCN